MSPRVSFSIVLIALTLACAAIVGEGRLFDPKSTETATSGAIISTDVSSSNSKFASFVDSVSSHTAVNRGNNNTSMCEHIHPEELPEECFCREPGPFSLVIECLKTFNSTYFNDTIGMKIDLDPCNDEGAKLSMDITEAQHGIDYPIAGIRAGESKNIPIPGFAMIVPGIGNVGLDAAVLIVGNPDMLRLKIGLNACAILSTDHQVCASSIPGFSNVLPWYVLKGTYSFGDVCESRRAGADVNVDADDEQAPTAIFVE